MALHHGAFSIALVLTVETDFGYISSIYFRCTAVYNIGSYYIYIDLILDLLDLIDLLLYSS